MLNLSRVLSIAANLVALLSLAACGGGSGYGGGGGGTPPPTYSIGGSLSGLGAGLSVVLRDNGGDNLTVSANVAFTFVTKVASGGAYAVTVMTQPTGQTCVVTGGTGTASANVSNVAVACTSNPSSNTFTTAAGAVKMDASAGTIGNASVVAAPAGAPSGISTPFGWFTFSITGLTSGATVTLTYTVPSGFTLVGFEKCINGACSALSGATISGNTLSYTVTDGGPGDADGAANGTITDPGAIVVMSSTTYSIGGMVSGLGSGLSVVLQDNGGDNKTVNANGLFTFATSVSSGGAYAVTVLTQPTGQACVITGGTGTASANVSSVAVSCSTVMAGVGRFLYGANNGDGTISAYTINSTTGALSVMGGSPYAAGTQPYELKVDPSGKYLYVVNENAGTVSAFSINTVNGLLTAVAGSPFAVGTLPESLTFDSSGTHLYVANVTSNNISAFSINATTGALTAITGSPFTVSGTNPQPQSIGTAGNFVYVVNGGTNTAAAFAVTAGTGALTAALTMATGVSPYSMAIDPSGAVAYVANAGTAGSSISAYTINSTTGALTPNAGNPLAIQPGNYLSIDPLGKFLFVPGATGVSVYPINTTTAALGTPAAGSPFVTGNNPYSVRVDPSGKFAYVANDGSGTVSAFTLNSSTGVLTAVTGSPFTAGQFPDFLAID